MTFTLGIMSLMTLNVLFVALGGGYKKFPPAQENKKEEEKDATTEAVRKVLFD